MKGEMIVIADDGLACLENRFELTAPPELEDLQARVGGGYIEVVPRFNVFEGKRCVALCNEDGKHLPLIQNTRATQLWADAVKRPFHELGDVLVGPIVILTGDKEFMEAL